MSCNYADGLSPYDNKGVVGLPEKFDDPDELRSKCVQLAKWINESDHVVFHTGAGISTSAGIPDFRGPNGVWTLEKRGLKPDINVSFDEARPTTTHMAIQALIDSKLAHFVVSQNIDGLHLKSGMARKYLAELHGNMFIEQCNTCFRQFVRGTATTSVGEKSLNKNCPRLRLTGRHCRGNLCDTILDWEANLPEKDLQLSEIHSSLGDLNICLGSTLQIVPSGNLPLLAKKYAGKLVIVNLQPTKHDKKADLIINAYVDQVMEETLKELRVPIPQYDYSRDPTKLFHDNLDKLVDWTIPFEQIKAWREVQKTKRKSPKKKKLS